MSWLDALINQWQAQSPAELVAVVCAIAYVVLAARQNRWCWPAAFVSTALYTWLYWQQSAPLQSLLNLYYLLMAVYGWWAWQPSSNAAELPVTQRRWQLHLSVIAALTLVSALLANWSANDDISMMNYVDAFITVFSLFATWLVTRKVLENWLYWIVIDAAGIWFNWQLGMYLTACLMVIYIIMATYGYLNWSRDYRAQPATV